MTQVSPASTMLHNEDLLKTMLYDTEDLESEEHIYTFLYKDKRFLKKQEIMGAVVQFWRHIGN